ncbi:MAG: hypothetical protein OXO54_04625 [Chloroflexota bacterium]|nr:hypothetical protein [Chloroflexota bacterium]
MSIASPERALSLVEEFRSHLNQNRNVHHQGGSAKARSHESHQELLRREPWIKRIEDEVNPQTESGSIVARPQTWSWQGWPQRVEALIGILAQWGDNEAIFSPAGPRLSASGLHPWVWNAAANLWDDGHYEPAVHAAAKAVELQTQLKVHRRDMDGKDLYARAFSTKGATPGEPRLRFPEIDSTEQPRRWTSAHEGAQYLGMGCAQGIRNPQAHPSPGLAEQEALEQLATLSVLARWVDACTTECVTDEAAGE